jgi:hypothetical protein
MMHCNGLFWNGIGVGAGVTLILLGIIYLIVEMRKGSIVVAQPIELGEEVAVSVERLNVINT